MAEVDKMTKENPFAGLASLVPADLVLEAALKEDPARLKKVQEVLKVARENPEKLKQLGERIFGKLPDSSTMSTEEIARAAQTALASFKYKIDSADPATTSAMNIFFDSIKPSNGQPAVGKPNFSCDSATEFYNHTSRGWVLKKEPYNVPEGMTPGDFISLKVPKLGEISHCPAPRR